MDPGQRRRPRHTLGEDGAFRLVRNAMGVPGFYVCVNAFSPDVHRRLFENDAFTTNAQPFVQQQAVPLEQAIIHPTRTDRSSSPWPGDWHRIINAVRDSGLFPGATIPDCGYGLTYRTGSTFEPHHDGRTKWGEYVICASLGAPCTVTFQHGAPKTKKPFDPSRPWDWVPPPPGPDSYYSLSQTDEVDPQYRRKLWQVTMTLPPNSMYVMSGASRYDWKHGINSDDGHTHPTAAAAAGAFLYPTWNRSGSRRAVIYRSTKVFSDVSLEIEHENALETGDVDAVESLVERLQAARRSKPQIDVVGGSVTPLRNMTEVELAETRAQARAVLRDLGRSGAHRLRFGASEVRFHSDGPTRAVADLAVGDEDDVPSQRRSGSGSDDFPAGGRRLGGAADSVPVRRQRQPEIVVIDESSEDEENDPAPPSVAQASASSPDLLGDGGNRGTKRLAEEAPGGASAERERIMRAARLQRFD